MGTPHKHRDVIIAWANGEAIEWKSNVGTWVYVKHPDFVEHYEYRIKPKRVKREGWVNISENGLWLHATKEGADRAAHDSAWQRKACVRIEREEEA